MPEKQTRRQLFRWLGWFGMANAIMKKHNCLPKDVYTSHLDELKKLMTKGVPGAPKLR